MSGGAVAPELVGNEPIRPVSLRLQELTKAAFGRLLVPMGLGYDNDCISIMIEGSP